MEPISFGGPCTPPISLPRDWCEWNRALWADISLSFTARVMPSTMIASRNMSESSVAAMADHLQNLKLRWWVGLEGGEGIDYVVLFFHPPFFRPPLSIWITCGGVNASRGGRGDVLAGGALPLRPFSTLDWRIWTIGMCWEE